MDTKSRNLLVKAKAQFYSWRMLDAYQIFRRYFDRLPFAPEQEHAEYIGVFIRTLFELGKEAELEFYLAQIEKLHEKNKAPYIAYPLGVVYSYSSGPRSGAAREIFEALVRDPNASVYHARAKMMLADHYDRKDDTLACRMLIESIAPTGDPSLDRLVVIWRALVARREKKYDDALLILKDLLKTFTVNEDWYSYFSAKLQVGMVCAESGKSAAAEKVLAEMRKLLEERRSRTVQTQVTALENRLSESRVPGKLKVLRRDDECTLSYEGKKLPLRPESPAEKLLMLLAKRRVIAKAEIVKGIYDRPYNGLDDDKMIYYHIHTLRKRLQSLGMPDDVITSEDNGYRLISEVETTGGDA